MWLLRGEGELCFRVTGCRKAEGALSRLHGEEKFVLRIRWPAYIWKERKNPGGARKGGGGGKNLTLRGLFAKEGEGVGGFQKGSNCLIHLKGGKKGEKVLLHLSKKVGNLLFFSMVRGT